MYIGTGLSSREARTVQAWPVRAPLATYLRTVPYRTLAASRRPYAGTRYHAAPATPLATSASTARSLRPLRPSASGFTLRARSHRQTQPATDNANPLSAV